MTAKKSTREIVAIVTRDADIGEREVVFVDPDGLSDAKMFEVLKLAGMVSDGPAYEDCPRVVARLHSDQMVNSNDYVMVWQLVEIDGLTGDCSCWMHWIDAPEWVKEWMLAQWAKAGWDIPSTEDRGHLSDSIKALREIGPEDKCKYCDGCNYECQTDKEDAGVRLPQWWVEAEERREEKEEVAEKATEKFKP